MQRLQETLEWLARAPTTDLKNKHTLMHWICHVGLFYDNRTSPHDALVSLYGSDAAYMLSSADHDMGIWQTPCQLAGFLIAISGKKIHTYLDIGTLTGWTTTIVAAYLKRFGLQHMDTLDVVCDCLPQAQYLWKEFDLPINYIVDVSGVFNGQLRQSYDFIFIDGNHEYEFVKRDFMTYRNKAKMLALHDINDYFCTGVVALWKEIQTEYKFEYNFYEFIDHPNGFKLMGIGFIEQKSSGVSSGSSNKIS
jgi:hypothetical protein